MAFLRRIIPLVALAGSAFGALQPLKVKGQKFFYENGTQFFVRGVAYQQDSSPGGGPTETDYRDPLADKALCERDVPLLKELGTNLIRTYSIDPKADHSACMKLLEDAGIYVISDLSEPADSINRDSPEWNVKLATRYKAVVDELVKYPSTMGFFAGNEVTNRENNTAASAYVKAAVRDTKKHIRDLKLNRWFGVGYATLDNKAVLNDMSNYFTCDNPEDAVDFWGFNVYSWCGESDMQKSSYNQLIKDYKDLTMPVFFAEYGCNENEGQGAERKFTEVEALYSDALTSVFSGGIVYMYYEETNHYGLVKIENGEAKKLNSFENLKEQLAKVRPKALTENDYNPTGEQPACPEVSQKWEANKELPPTPNKSLCDCMVKSRSCVMNGSPSSEKMRDIFSFVCGNDVKICAGIGGNATTGVYGAYHMCDDSAKLAYAMDGYVSTLKSSGATCDFGGLAKTQSPATEAACSAGLAEASDVNKQAATATAPIKGVTTNTKDSSAAQGLPRTRDLSFGDWAISLYLLAALGTGAAVLVL